MTDQLPPILYKYRALDSENAREMVKRTIQLGEVYFPPTCTFNDPFESRFSLDFSGSRNDIINRGVMHLSKTNPGVPRSQLRHRARALARANWLNPNSIEQIYDRVRRKIVTEYGVYCLSEIANNCLMWSHYADKHQGICLGFDPTIGNWRVSGPHKIDYSKDIPVVRYMGTTPEQLGRGAILTKAIEWAYENEWRYILAERASVTIQVPLQSLTTIVFGMRTTDETKATVRDWTGNRVESINFLEARPSPGKYELELVPSNT